MNKFLNKDKIDALYDALDAGMTQRQVAERLGCSVSTVNDWKKRRDNGEYDAAGDAPDDPNEVLEWDNVVHRCDAAQRLCRLTQDVTERMELLSAALWPNPANYNREDSSLNRTLLDNLPTHREDWHEEWRPEDFWSPEWSDHGSDED